MEKKVLMVDRLHLWVGLTVLLKLLWKVCALTSIFIVILDRFEYSMILNVSVILRT